MNSVSETLKNIFKQILSVVAAFYLLFGIKMEFTWERAKKNFDERKKLYKDTALQVSVVIFFLLILFFHFCVPGIYFLSVISVSFLFSALAFIFAMVPVWIAEKFLKTRISAPPSSYYMSDTTFKPVFIPVPTSPPRFNPCRLIK